MEGLPLPWCEAEWQSSHCLRHKSVVPFAANLLRTQNLFKQGKITDDDGADLRDSNPFATFGLVGLSDLHSQLASIHAHLFDDLRELSKVDSCWQALPEFVHELWNHGFS